MSRILDASTILRRAHQAWHEQLTDRCPLDCGIAFTSADYPTLREGNQFREVLLSTSVPIEAAYEEVESFFAQKDRICYAWTPALEQPSEPLAAFLAARRFQANMVWPMVLTEWPRLEPNPRVRILPARPARAAFREICAEVAGSRGDETDEFVDAMNDRIDDPSLDMAVAVVDSRPAGIMDLFQIGDIGFIKTAYVSVPFRRTGVGRTLLAHTLQLAQRLALRHIGAEASDEAMLAFFRRAAFEPGTQMVTFSRVEQITPA